MARSISAIRGASRRPVFVATRADYACRELARHIEPTWTDVHFVAPLAGQDEKRAGVCDRQAVDDMIDAVADVVARSAQADLVFLGADDYLGALASRLPAYRDRLGSARPFVFLYNTERLRAQPFGEDATLLAFDETLHERPPGTRVAKGLPDPWHGHFSRGQRQRVREAIGLEPEAILVALNLDRLLDDDDPSALADMERLAQIPCVHFALHGSVWSLRDARFRQLAKRYGQRLIYAGTSHKVHGDIRLIAAADLLLSGVDASPCERHAGDARPMRAAALGSAFDRDVRRLMLDSVEAVREMPTASMKLMRDELDRRADERLNCAFGMQLRSAIRRGE
ncbi:hypothetical protein [Paraburkholderia sp. J67]|uniref:hypothetical protein n=1 Tax=Paraburkholderia sp. J67 TaxID=2805435 RepID=UPI002ABE5445|nr:hypothetical protein [Paraburkholderia sp. J67]